jgi:hypothetical protein
LIPGTILKRAMKGALDILPVTNEVQQSLSRARSPVPELGTGPLAAEVQLAELVRKATIYVTGTAAMKLMTELEKEQETMTLLSDMCIDAYTIDSVVRRAIQAQSESTPEHAQLHADLARVSAHTIYERAIARARRVVIELFPNEDQYTRVMELKRLDLNETVPLVPMKRSIARAVLDRDGYPFTL